MTSERLPISRPSDALVFEPVGTSPLLRRGMSRLNQALVGTARPKALPPLIANIPFELTMLRQWVCWTWEFREGKWRKPLLDPGTGEPATEMNASTWGTFDEACRWAAREGLPGIGFVFTRRDPYTGVDLDRCRQPETGEIDPWADVIVAALDSYSEISPSGTGVHVLVRGALRAGRERRKGLVELYDEGQYFTFTGHRLHDMPEVIKSRQDEIDALQDNLFCREIDEEAEPWLINQPTSNPTSYDLAPDPWDGEDEPCEMEVLFNPEQDLEY